MQLSNNKLSGVLLSSWGNNGSFTALMTLSMANNSLTGPLPATWASSTSFSQLQELDLKDNQLSGRLAVFRTKNDELKMEWLKME